MVGNVAIDLSHTDDSRADFTGKGMTQVGTDTPYTFDEDFIIEGYTVANARMGVTASTNQWGASIWVRNLTDEFYITNTIQHGDMVSRYAGMPRTYGLTVIIYVVWCDAYHPHLRLNGSNVVQPLFHSPPSTA
jgi:iron complex outermembrane recepter protein